MADIKIRYVGVDDASDESKKVAGGIKDIEDAAGNAKGGVSSFFKDAFSFVTGGLITSALSSVTGAVGGLVSGMVSGNAEFERYEVQFGVLLKSTDAAKQRLADLAKFGASTPFDLPEVVKADKILQGFGLHSEESAAKFGKSGEEIRRIAGDVAAGTGSSFEDMALLIGKLSAGASGEAISRMAELGIASKEELAKMGLEFDKGGALLSPLPQAMQVVTDLMNQKFGGMMDKQSATFEGMTSNFNDWIQGTIRAAGAPVFEQIKGALGALLTQLQNPAFQAAITAVASAIGSVLSGAISSIVPIISTFLEVIENVSRALGSGGGLTEVITQTLGTVIKSFGGFEDAAYEKADGVVAALQPVINFFETLMDYTTAGFQEDGFLGGVVGAITGLVAAFGVGEDATIDFGTTLWDGLQKVLADVQGILAAVFDTFKNVFGAVVALVSAELKVIVQFWTDHGTEITAKIKSIWNSVVEIIKLALALINATIVPLLKAIATFIGQHGTEIGNVFKGAWDVISGIVDTALAVITGIVKIALALLKGDSQGALDGLAGMFTRVWDNIKNIVKGAWDFISNIVKLATDAIARITGQQSAASGITVSYNPAFQNGVAGGVGQGARSNSAGGSISMAGDTYNVNNSNVAGDIQRARKQATQAAMLRATVGV